MQILLAMTDEGMHGVFVVFVLSALHSVQVHDDGTGLQRRFFSGSFDDVHRCLS